MFPKNRLPYTSGVHFLPLSRNHTRARYKSKDQHRPPVHSVCLSADRVPFHSPRFTQTTMVFRRPTRAAPGPADKRLRTSDNIRETIIARGIIIFLLFPIFIEKPKPTLPVSPPFRNPLNPADLLYLTTQPSDDGQCSVFHTDTKPSSSSVFKEKTVCTT